MLKNIIFYAIPMFWSIYAHAQQNRPLPLFEFEKDDHRTFVTEVSARYERVANTALSRLKIVTDPKVTKPGIILKRPKQRKWNLEGYYEVKADVTNLGSTKMQVEMFVGNDPDGLIRWYCSDYVDLEPSETKTITVALAWSPWVHFPQPNIVGMRGIPGKIKTAIDKIDQIAFYSRYAINKDVFTIGNIRAVGQLEVRDTTGFFPFIDRFGQYRHKDWKGKTHTVDELVKEYQREQAELHSSTTVPDRSAYGGWSAGPRLKGTGFFRTEKYQGKWWMVDPEGYLFWSNGVNCVSPTTGTTGITHREHYFQSLPSDDNNPFYSQSSWASHGFYKGKVPYTTYNFYGGNLNKKYGPEWLEKFRETVHLRFRHWGLNTIGFVSDRGAIDQRKTPYVGSIWIRNTIKIEGSEGFWGKFHDVYDERFKTAVKASILTQQKGAGDPWCIGFFIDNELSWGDVGSLAIAALRSPATQAAKIEFVKDLRKKYKKIAALNTVWGTRYRSWEALLQSKTVPDEKRAEDDLFSFYEKTALTYFKIIKEGLHTIAPDQNYLGCRFAWANNDIVLKSAARYIDIISFNKYEYSVANVGLPTGVDKPIMIGEFHFGATDRGHFHAGVKAAKNQEERALFYQDYMEGALKNPLIVGAHWFQYIDQPFTGRGDGENYNVGLVDVADTPYKELIDKVKEIGRKLYTYRMRH